MYLDAIDLREFYNSRLGLQTRARLRMKINHVWPKVTDDRVLGIGYPTPFLRPFMDDAERVLAFMPASQGVFRWPKGEASATALIADHMLPLADASVDRVLLVHSLEVTDNPRELLAEIWRVLSPGGRLLVIVPNRAGLWARMENSPFGYGRPFSRRQLNKLMRDALFSPVGWVSALHTPPIERRSFLTANWMENSGERFWSRLSGVFLMEAIKEFYQGIPVRKKHSFAPAFKPILVPSPQPSSQTSSCSANKHPLLRNDEDRLAAK